MLFIDAIILALLSVLWGRLKRRMHLHDHWVREMLATLWRRHGHSRRPVTSTISDGRQR